MCSLLAMMSTFLFSSLSLLLPFHDLISFSFSFVFVFGKSKKEGGKRNFVESKADDLYLYVYFYIHLDDKVSMPSILKQ